MQNQVDQPVQRLVGDMVGGDMEEPTRGRMRMPCSWATGIGLKGEEGRKGDARDADGVHRRDATDA